MNLSGDETLNLTNSSDNIKNLEENFKDNNKELSIIKDMGMDSIKDMPLVTVSTIRNEMNMKNSIHKSNSQNTNFKSYFMKKRGCFI